MHDDGDEQLLDIRRQDMAAAVEERPGPRRLLERQAAAHGGSDRHAVEVTGRAHEVDDPVVQQLVDVHESDGIAKLIDLGERHHRLERAERVPEALLLDDATLVFDGRIPERRLEEESVELRLGQ